MIPAMAESMMPLMPEDLPRNLTICEGLKKRFMQNSKMKTKTSGIIILTRILPVFLSAMNALSGITTKKIP